MPTPQIFSGLPQFLLDFQTRITSFCSQTYLAMNSLAKAAANATGMNSYTPEEMGQVFPLAALSTQNHTRIFLKATQDIAFGKLVHIKLDGTSLSAEIADATNNTKPAQAICNQPEGVLTGGFGEFLLYTGYTLGVVGTGIGATYYLGTNGDSQLARPAAAGSIIQSVGIGFGSLGFYLQISSLFLQN